MASARSKIISIYRKKVFTKTLLKLSLQWPFWDWPFYLVENKIYTTQSIFTYVVLLIQFQKNLNPHVHFLQHTHKFQLINIQGLRCYSSVYQKPLSGWWVESFHCCHIVCNTSEISEALDFQLVWYRGKKHLTLLSYWLLEVF